jgi:hypothetical protein
MYGTTRPTAFVSSSVKESIYSSGYRLPMLLTEKDL